MKACVEGKEKKEYGSFPPREKSKKRGKQEKKDIKKQEKNNNKIMRAQK